MSKRASLLLFAILAVLSLGLIAVMPERVSAAISKPSVPQFTVKFVNASYGVTTTNPYTGLSETKLISNNSIEVTIRNQPFGYSGYQIYYNVRVKPHFAENWTEIYPIQNMTSAYNGDGTFSYALYVNRDSPAQSSSSYTNITFPVVPTELYQASGYDIRRHYSGTEGQEGTYFAFLYAIPAGGQVDFQVQALVGQNSTYWYVQHPLFPTYGGYSALAVAYDGASSWSNTQTITIPVSSTSSPYPAQFTEPSQSSEPQPKEPFPTAFVAAASVAAVIMGASLLVYFKKHKSGGNVYE